jgi:hypothetical protein
MQLVANNPSTRLLANDAEPGPGFQDPQRSRRMNQPMLQRVNFGWRRGETLQ